MNINFCIIFHDTLNLLCSCSLEIESLTHFMLHCPFYINPRTALNDNLLNIGVLLTNLSDDIKLNILLYGNKHLYSNETNTLILKLTIVYLKSTEGFEGALF